MQITYNITPHNFKLYIKIILYIVIHNVYNIRYIGFKLGKDN